MTRQSTGDVQGGETTYLVWHCDGGCLSLDVCPNPQDAQHSDPQGQLWTRVLTACRPCGVVSVTGGDGGGGGQERGMCGKSLPSSPFCSEPKTALKIKNL